MIEVRIRHTSAAILQAVKGHSGEAFSVIKKNALAGNAVLTSSYPKRYAESLPGLVKTVQKLAELGADVEIRHTWEDGDFRLVDVNFLLNLIESRRITDLQDQEFIDSLADAE